MTEKFGVSVSEDTADKLHSHLDYGDSRSEWIEQAIIERLERVESEKLKA